MKNRRTSILNNDNGFAPLIITVIVVIILSLLTVGFISLMSNNQKNSLNQQLNNDAYYAAETGVNDAIKAIDSGYTSSKLTCGPLASSGSSQPGQQYLENNIVNGPNDKYSCLLINPAPSSLQYSSIGLNQPTVVAISAINNSHIPTNIGSIEISWQPSPQAASSPYTFAPYSWLQTCPQTTGPCLPPQTSWMEGSNPITGILRAALTPLYTGSLPTDTSSTYTAFLYPSVPETPSSVQSIASGPAYGPSTIGSNAGEVIGGLCQNGGNSSGMPDACNVSIDVSSANTSAFLLSLRSIYNRTQVTIQVFDQYHNPLMIQGAQTMIDSTGYSHGVLRRIQVRVPRMSDTGFPAFDLETTNKLCKDISTYPQNLSTGNAGNTQDPNCKL